jgi:leucyl-tRNA synthetase
MVTKDGSAMSKSKGNVVDPDEMIDEYGADTLRLFILFAAPPEKEFAWNEKGIEGSFRFLHRIWMFFHENRTSLCRIYPEVKRRISSSEEAGNLLTKTHQTIRKVSEDIERRLHLNTAVSSIMELFNMIKKESEILSADESGGKVLQEAFENLILLLSPFTPHICEELWSRMGHDTLLAQMPWPSFDPDLAREESVTIVIQINGKLRDRFETERGLPEEKIKEMAVGLPRIQSFIDDKPIKKIVVIKDKLVNIVV